MKDKFSNAPFRPAAFPFHYGWIILVAGGLGLLMSSPGQTFGVSPFTDSLIDSLGLTRVQLSTAYMFGTILSSFLLTFGGKAYDRYGARAVGFVSSVTLGAILVIMSRCDVISIELESAFGKTHRSNVALVVVLLCFAVLRLSGQGVLTMVSRNMIMKWFDRRRGTVMGILGMVMSPIFACAPMLFNTTIKMLGWRNAWLLMGTSIGLAFSVIVAVLWRDNPEECGLAPDGLRERPSGQAENAAHEGRQFTLREAMSCYSFWTFTLGLSLFSLYVTGYTFHVASIFENAGMTREKSFSIFLPAALISIVLQPVVGRLCDRVKLKYILAFMLIGIAVSSAGVLSLAPGYSVWLVIAGNGMSGPAFGMLSAVTWPNFFGRKYLGTISGMNMSLMVFFSAIGPWIFSKSLAGTGSYRTAAVGSIVVCMILTAASLWAENPRRSEK